MRGQKPLSLPVGFELAEDLLSFTGWPVRHFDRIVQALVGAMVSVQGQCFDRFDRATCRSALVDPSGYNLRYVDQND